MILARRTVAIAIALCLALQLALAAVVPTHSFAAPEPASTEEFDSSESTASRVGPCVVTFAATATAVPVGGGFSYEANVRSRSEIDYAQVRMRLFMPQGGKLIYQKTFVAQSLEPGTRTFTFERTIQDIGLRPEVYPIELLVDVSAKGRRYSEVLEGRLLVYDPTRERLPVALIARVSAVPLTEPDGAFVLDPAAFTRARNDVTLLADHVLADERSRLALALSPVMLEEWRRIAEGYRYEGPEGAVEVSEDAAVPRSYAIALEKLRSAVLSGRLEILSTGYSDPSLSELSAAGLLADIAPQYDTGISSCFAALGTTPSTGTAPAGGSLSEAAGKALAAQGIGYVVVRNRRAVLGKSPAPAGVYSAQGSSLNVLASDDEIARALVSSPTATVSSRLYERYLERPESPVPVSVSVGPGSVSASSLIELAESVAGQPWSRLQLSQEVAASKPDKRVRLVGAPADKRSPSGHWRAVARARMWAEALVFALGTKDDFASDAMRDSLTAECSSWAGVDASWAHASRSAAFAAKAENKSREVLDAVSVSARPVTLAGSRGEVPITIKNDSERELRVKLLVRASHGMSLGGSASQVVSLQPQENYIELPVDLRGRISGDLRVRVVADDVVIADTTVDLRASVMDRLVIVAGIVLVLGGLLAFIIARVRAAEAGEGNAAPTRTSWVRKSPRERG